MIYCFSFLSVLSLRLCVCFSTACQTFVFLLIVCVLSHLMLVISLRSFSYSIGVFTEHRSSQACYPAGRGLRSWAPLMLKYSTCSENTGVSWLRKHNLSAADMFSRSDSLQGGGERTGLKQQKSRWQLSRGAREDECVWEEPHFRLLQEHSGPFRSQL